MLTGFGLAGSNPAMASAALAELQVPAAIVATCEQQVAAPKVDVELQEAAIMETHKYNIVELSELSKHFNNSHVDEGKVLGLTDFEYGYELHLSYQIVVSATSDITCVRPHFTVRVSSQLHNVHIAKDYLPKSCEYKAIRRHEYRHVTINEEFLRNFARTISAEFLGKFGSEIYYGTFDAIKNNISLDNTEKWQPFINAILAPQIVAAAQQHEQVDTLEEYRKFSYVCSNKYRYIPEQHDDAVSGGDKSS